MYPKTKLNELQRRRLINERLQFVMKRLREMPLELRFAAGKSEALPARASMPPAWALAAATEFDRHIAAPIAHLDPAKKNWDAGDLAEFAGHVQAIACFISNWPRDVREMEQEVPEIAKLRKPVERQVERTFQKFVRRLRRVKMIDAPVPPADILAALRTREAKGLGSFSRDGELVALKRAQTRLCYGIWMFWPEFAKDFTAPRIHSWMKSELGESFGDKTVEAVVTKLRKESKRFVQP